MKKRINATLIFAALSLVFVLSGCAGMAHTTYMGEGHTKSEVMEKFGPPERVIPSTEGVETWEYTMGGAVKAYTFQGDVCVKDRARSDN